MSPDGVTHLCQEICNIERGSQLNNRLGQINKLKKLSKHLSNTPDLDWGKHDKDGPSYAETEYNKLPVGPPTDSPDIQAHCEPPQSPDQPLSTGTPSGLPPPHAPSGHSARTSSLASSNITEDPEESPVVGRASGSPDSPSTIKASL